MDIVQKSCIFYINNTDIVQESVFYIKSTILMGEDMVHKSSLYI